ncbi:unnamed protein product, partial [Mesorhabditis spiculigera]
MKNDGVRSSSASGQGRTPYGAPGGYGLPGPPGQQPPHMVPPPPGHQELRGGFPNLGPGLGQLFPQSNSPYSNPNGQFRPPDRPDNLQGLGTSGLGMQNNPFASRQMSMSPSTQMMRSGMPGGPPGQPLAQRQNSSSGSWGNLPPPGAMRNVTGATTPQGQIDFRPQLPPTGANSDLQIPTRNNYAPPNVSSEQDVTQTQFSDEVQDEANTYFMQIYSPTKLLTVENFLAKLRQFQTSQNQRDRDVLACVIKNLFEEYQFFQEYPERELLTTAEVYGGIIRDTIITNLQFATAVRKVIESLQTDTNSRLYQFGLAALNVCKNKLCCYPKVCAMIMQHENFAKFPPQLVSYVKAGITEKQPQANGRETPQMLHSPQSTGSGPLQQSSPQRSDSMSALNPGLNARQTGSSSRAGPGALSLTNAETLILATEKEGAECAKPPETVVDKVSFLFNNLSQSNLTAKTDEMREIIEEHGETFTAWLSQYIVIKRVSTEPNFQPLYNSFLVAIEDRSLDNFVKEETLRNIKVLLRSDKRMAASNYSDRTLLKNLGIWLGTITIARNRAFTLEELDLKSLLMEAYYKGQAELLFVVPFVAKVIHASGKPASLVFTANSSWIRGIMKIMAELHDEPDLRINLKFEIEVLCKDLGVSLENLLTMVDGELKDTDKLLGLKQQLSDVRELQQPSNLGTSPIPAQMRMAMGTGADLQNIMLTGSEGRNTPLPDAAGEGPGLEPAAPRFHFHELASYSQETIAQYITVPADHFLFHLHAPLKQFIRPALVQAIKELLADLPGPVADRSLKVGTNATECLARKDFGFASDEQQLRHNAHFIAAAMAYITVREAIHTTVFNYLTQTFTHQLRGVPHIDPKMIEDCAMRCMLDNLELIVNFVTKATCEKAALEAERRLEPDFHSRMLARREQKEWVPSAEYLESQEMLPEKLRTPAGPLQPELLAVYEEFLSKICGFKASTPDEFMRSISHCISSTASNFEMDMRDPQELEKYSQLFRNLAEECGRLYQRTNGNPALVKVARAFSLLREKTLALSAEPSNPALLKDTFTNTMEQFLNSYIPSAIAPQAKEEAELVSRVADTALYVLQALVQKNSHQMVAQKITELLITSQMDFRFNIEAVEMLISQKLIITDQYDRWLGEMIEHGQHSFAAVFAQKLLRLIYHGSGSDSDIRARFPLTFEQLQKLQTLNNMRPLETGIAQSPIGGATGNYFQGQERLGHNMGEDNFDLQGKAEQILREWISLCYTPLTQREPQQALANMIHMMHEHGVLATDQMITKFFRLCIDMCVDVSYRLLKEEQGSPNSVIRQRCYYTLDAFVKLTCLMVKYSDGNQTHTKINLFKKVLNLLTNVLMSDHETRRQEFNPMPYHRILISLFNELSHADPALENIGWPIMEAFGQALFSLQPRRAPRFATAWLDIVGHRNVIGRLVATHYHSQGEPTVENLKAVAIYVQFLICQLKFLAPYLRNLDLPKSITLIYRGTLRIFLVLLHDFPEMLCEYHFILCDNIPPNCIQFRNLQVDSIPEMAIEPKMKLEMPQLLPAEMRSQIDNYLSNRLDVELLSSLPTLLTVSQVAGSKYNTTVLHALVLYVGMRAVESLHAKGQRISMTTIAHTAFMDIFQNLAVRLCTEGRYSLFNAIANQLRYPNAHTHYFSCTLLYLFQQADMNVMKEQITRILFERLVALRPHPWGLLVTFIELIRNPNYCFWDHDFTKCTPEIEKLFMSVATTCNSVGGHQAAVADTTQGAAPLEVAAAAAS